MTTPTIKPPSKDQLDLIQRLCVERSFDLAAADVDIAKLTGGRGGTASALITFLFGIPRTDGVDNRGTSRVDPEAGLYRVGDEIVRIKLSRSGNWYAMMAAKMPGRTTLQWEYLGKRINMKDAQPMEDAEAGKYLGFCVRCNAELTDPESIARGLGPICKDKV